MNKYMPETPLMTAARQTQPLNFVQMTPACMYKSICFICGEPRACAKSSDVKVQDHPLFQKASR